MRFGYITGRIMFGTQNFEVFLLAGITQNLPPGQDTMYIIGRSLAQERVAGIVSVLGISSGCIFHIAAAIGLYSMLTLSPVSFTVICRAGIFYIIYLGIMTIVYRYNTQLVLCPENKPQGK